MSDKDQIKELFSQKLGQYEAKVRPDLWANVASQVSAASSAASSSGLSLVTKVIIGISAAGVITTGVILFNANENSSNPTKDNNDPVVTQVKQKLDEELITENQQDNIQPTANKNQNDLDNSVKEVEVLQNSTETKKGPSEKKYIVDNPEHTTEKKSDPQKVAVVPEATIEKRPENTEKETSSKPLMKVEPTDQLAGDDNPIEGIEAENEKKEVVQPFELVNLPNVFTPDGDGTNDFFFLDLPELNAFQILVLDQNGETVFESNDPEFKWDGRDIRTGNRVKKGIHTYIIIAENTKGQVAKAREFLMITFD